MKSDAHSLQIAGGGPGFDAPQQAQANEFRARDETSSMAGRAFPVSSQLKVLLDPLPIDLQKTVVADPSDGDPGPIHLHGISQGFFYLAVVPAEPHVDEIDHDEATDIAHAELAAYFFGGLHIGARHGVFVTGATLRFAGVHVDGGQGFRAIDDDGASAGQSHGAVVDAVDLLI